MRALDVEQKAYKRLIKPGGLTGGSRVFTSDTLSDGDLAAVFTLPFAAGNTQQLQDASTGALFFMLDVDPLDGGNALQ